MRGKRSSAEKIIGILKEAEAGIAVQELCRKYGMSDGTYYNWKAKYGGLTVSEARRLKSLEEENRRLKKMYAEAQLSADLLKEALSKKW